MLSQKHQYKLKTEILALAKDHMVEDWDSDGALPISLDVLYYAYEAVNLLPSCIILPSITPEIDGTISFDWNEGKGHLLSCGIIDDNKVVFVGILDGKKIDFITYNSTDLAKEFRTILLEHFMEPNYVVD